jgi:hypothetical protein
MEMSFQADDKYDPTFSSHPELCDMFVLRGILFLLLSSTSCC